MLDKIVQILIVALYIPLLMCLAYIGYNGQFSTYSLLGICSIMLLIVLYLHLDKIPSTPHKLNKPPIISVKTEDDYWTISMRFLIPIILIINIVLFINVSNNAFFAFFIVVLTMSFGFDAYTFKPKYLHFNETDITIYTGPKKYVSVDISNIKNIVIEPYRIEFQTSFWKGLYADFDVKDYYQDIIQYIDEKIDTNQVNLIDRTNQQ